MCVESRCYPQERIADGVALWTTAFSWRASSSLGAAAAAGGVAGPRGPRSASRAATASARTNRG
jgi:hypothetical protein